MLECENLISDLVFRDLGPIVLLFVNSVGVGIEEFFWRVSCDKTSLGQCLGWEIWNKLGSKFDNRRDWLVRLFRERR